MVLPTSGSGQTRNRADHRGMEFRVAFLHTNGAETESPAYYLVVSCEKPTTARITYEATGLTQSIPVPVANTPVRIKLDTTLLLLPNPADPLFGTEISRQTLTVRFDDESTLYAINTLRWSSDSYLSLPTDAVGTEYTIMSYPNTAEPNTFGQILESSDFPSQFAVIGTQDGTRITIQPTVSINGGGSTRPFDIMLNAGEIYFAQARGKGIAGRRAGDDLTGSRIISDKPIIVYGSHQRANIPWNDAVGRDHLVEQMPPTDKWGYHAMVTPHFQLKKTVEDANFIRVLAAEPGTVLMIDSGTAQSLPVGRAVEIPLKRAMLLTSNKKICVAQFQHSTVDVDFISVENDTIGDPFMMLVPPREQFDSNYTFESWSTKDFFYHFINVVIPTERISSLKLDGVPVSANFLPIPKTSYSYAQIPVRAGGHNISARVPFGLYIYGYGPYNSYGTPGGMVFDSLFSDHQPPDITRRDTCNGLVGEAFDTSAYDFGMESLRLLGGSQNVKLITQEFSPGDDSIRFRVELQDPYQDGLASLMAVDTAGLQRRYDFKVKGFTVAVTGGTPPVPLDTLASLNGLEFCTLFTVRNYGSFPQQIDGIRLRDNVPGLEVKETFPFTLQPGESRNIQVCFQHEGDTSALVEIGLDNGCTVRPVAMLPLLSGIDSLRPVLSRLSDECDDNVIFEIAEAYAINSGIAYITLNKVINAEVITPETLPSKKARVEIHRKSIWKDVIYDIDIVDVVGNTTRIYDTIGGLTLEITDQASIGEYGFRLDPAIPWEYEPLIYTRKDCDTLWLENTGLKPLDLRRLRFIGNLEFSVPPDQLPLRLQPKERKAIEVCVQPRSAGEFQDTMIVEFFCGRLVNVIEFKSLVDPLSGRGEDRCGNRMGFNVMGFTKQNFLENPSPNPTAKGVAVLTFGLQEDEEVTIGLYDGLGNEVRRFLDRDPMPGGIGQIHAELGELSSGEYYVRMETGSGDVFVRPLVIRQ